MTKVTLDITMSLDGFVAGPEPTVEQPLGAGGEQLHEWLHDLVTFQEHHGRPGQSGPRTPDDDVLQ